MLSIPGKGSNPTLSAKIKLTISPTHRDLKIGRTRDVPRIGVIGLCSSTHHGFDGSPTEPLSGDKNQRAFYFAQARFVGRRFQNGHDRRPFFAHRLDDVRAGFHGPRKIAVAAPQKQTHTRRVRRTGLVRAG
jgi:hypothetical protein